MTTKQYLQLQDIYAENCDASGNLTTLYPALGLGVKGNYQVGILNASALDTSGVESWMFAIGQDFDADNHILYENSNVSYEVNGTSGLFTVSGMQGTRTDDMVEWIGDQETPTVVGELIGMGADHNKNKPVALVQWRMFMRNRVDPEGEEPSVVPNYATTDDLARLLYTKTVVEDTEFTLDEEDGDSITDIAISELPDFAYMTIPAKLDAIKIDGEDAYGLLGVSGVSGEFNTSEQTPFETPIKLNRNDTGEGEMAEYSASWRVTLVTIGGTPSYYSDYYNFILIGPENGTVIDGDAEAQWMLKVESKHTSGAEFVEALRYYAPRKTETNNLLIPVSGGEFTGDIFKEEFNRDFFYYLPSGNHWPVTQYNGNTTIYYSTTKCNFFPPPFLDGDVLQCSGYDNVFFTRIPNTDNFEWVRTGEGLQFWQKMVLEKNGSDYLWRNYYATVMDDRQWVESTEYPPLVLSGFNPFKDSAYAHTSGGIFENGIYDGRKSDIPIAYYVTDRLEGASASIYTSIGTGYDTLLLVPSSINVEMNDNVAVLQDGVQTKLEGRNQAGPEYAETVYLRKVDDGYYTASGENGKINYFYSLNVNANGASLDVTYASAGNFYSLTTLTGNTEEREKPTYLPYLTYSEFSYEDEVQSLTTDSGNLTIYDNPWKQPDYLRAKVLLPGNRVWEGTLPRYANTGTYLRSSFIYEGLAIFRIGVSVASNPPNYIIAYDSGGESGDWDIPQEFGTHRFIPTSGGTFTGEISASDSQPYATSGYYEGLVQSKIDNPIYAGDNYSMVASLVTDLGNFSPFGGSDVILEQIYGPFNESSLGTIATRELKVSNSEVSANWHRNEFNWLHAPITISEPGSTHYYYITARLKVTSTDPFELMDPSLWTLDCWKID